MTFICVIEMYGIITILKLTSESNDDCNKVYMHKAFLILNKNKVFYFEHWTCDIMGCLFFYISFV